MRCANFWPRGASKRVLATPSGRYNAILSLLSIVIAAYKEERRLPSTLDELTCWLDAGEFADTEIIVVDDGSADGTAALVEARSAADRRMRLLRNPGNRGKGYAVRHGMLDAKGAWILFSDADLSAPIEELPKLLDT